MEYFLYQSREANDVARQIVIFSSIIKNREPNAKNLTIKSKQIHAMHRTSSSTDIIRLYYRLEYPTNRFMSF